MRSVINMLRAVINVTISRQWIFSGTNGPLPGLRRKSSRSTFRFSHGKGQTTSEPPLVHESERDKPDRSFGSPWSSIGTGCCPARL
jgi:hypothetical protein